MEREGQAATRQEEEELSRHQMSREVQVDHTSPTNREKIHVLAAVVVAVVVAVAADIVQEKAAEN